LLLQAAWEGYVTLLRFPVEIRPAYISVLERLRKEIALTAGTSEEKIFDEAMKVVTQLGEIKLVDVKPHVE